MGGLKPIWCTELSNEKSGFTIEMYPVLGI